MIKLTKHVKIRYAQRVLGIENEYEAFLYVKKNEVQISYDLWQLYLKSKLIYENYTYDQVAHTTGDVRLYKNIMIITSSNNLAMLTLWKIDFFASNQNTDKLVNIMNANKDIINRTKCENKKIGKELTKLENVIEHLETQLIELRAKEEALHQHAGSIGEAAKNAKVENRKIMQHFMYGWEY